MLNRPLLRVWCLHEVKNSQIKEFERKIKYLQAQYCIIGPKDFLAGNLSKTKVNILMAFDDGYESWFANVLPMLENYGVKAIFFLEKYFEAKAGPLLTAGHVLGGHSEGHPYLSKISDADLAGEVDNSVKSLFFAYPFGSKKSFNAKVISAVAGAGYKYGFTILPGFNGPGTEKYLMHRDSLDADAPMWLFKIWLKGAYDLIKNC